MKEVQQATSRIIKFRVIKKIIEGWKNLTDQLVSLLITRPAFVAGLKGA